MTLTVADVLLLFLIMVGGLALAAAWVFRRRFILPHREWEEQRHLAACATLDSLCEDSAELSRSHLAANGKPKQPHAEAQRHG